MSKIIFSFFIGEIIQRLPSVLFTIEGSYLVCELIRTKISQIEDHILYPNTQNETITYLYRKYIFRLGVIFRARK